MAKTEQKERVIVLIGGDSGCGKSFFIANIPDALIYDTDIGGGAAYLETRIKKNDSMRVEVASFREIKDDIRNRSQSGELKKFKTVVIDHVTGLHQEAVLRHNPGLARDFGNSNEAATKEWRQLREFVRNMDFNLVCTEHLKDRYENDKVTGQKSDAAKNIDADFSIVLHLKRKAAGFPSMANVSKWRRDPDDPRGPVPAQFDFTFEKFCELTGTTMRGERVELAMATPEQITEYKRLLGTVQVDAKVLEKWSKADVEDLNAKQIQERIDYCKKLVA